MNVLRISTEGALPSGLPDVFLGLGDSPQQAERGTDDEPVPRFCKGLYKHLPCLPNTSYSAPGYLSGENFKSIYGSISRIVAILKSTSREIARTMLGASIAPMCCRLTPI